MTQAFIEKKIKEFEEKFKEMFSLVETHLDISERENVAIWLRQTLTEALAMQKGEIVEKLEEMKLNENGYILPQSHRGFYEKGYDEALGDAIAKIME